ncbi:hypothetical protein [Streptomyces sp. HUAS ZL42]|uniref:hypothetical protein n=1 Tax=Streptomyces sp. HUAS ZL42 TaxID=3231715 RepID=UPI00345E77F0
MPVRLDLAGWDTTRGLDGWLTQHLVQDPDFDLHPAVASALVRHRWVLPVLDGLDEMDSDTTPADLSRARAALEILNARSHSRDPAPIVITCRQDRYASLAEQGYYLRDAAWIIVQPVAAAKAVGYLKRRDTAGRWQPVVTALTTPWRLTLAVGAYAEEGSGGASA